MNRIWLVASPCLVASAVAGCGNNYIYLTYKDYILQGPTSANINRLFPSDPNTIPNLFVRTPNGEVCSLDQLPEEVVGRLARVQKVRDGDLDRYECDATSLTYKNGKLVTLMIGEGPLQIGVNRAGPFRSLPMTQDEVRGLFGEPERSGTASRPMFKVN